jgi:hypothetical protein
MIGESKDISEYKHVIVLDPGQTGYSAINIRCHIDDIVTIDMERLEKWDKGNWWISIYDPFGNNWKSYKIRDERHNVYKSINIPADGTYTMRIATNTAHSSTIAYTITLWQGTSRGTDIRFPGSGDLK